MVGKPTPGFAALDEEREASMANEGGWSGALMESEDPSQIPAVLRDDRPRSRSRSFVIGIAVGLAGAVWILGRMK
jgi:hypothetical protein